MDNSFITEFTVKSYTETILKRGKLAKLRARMYSETFTDLQWSLANACYFCVTLYRLVWTDAV